MRLPSMQQISRDLREMLVRFPLPFSAALVGTVAAIILIGHTGPAQPTILWSLLFGGIVGIPLLTGATLAAETRRHNPLAERAILLAGVILLVAYAVSVPQDIARAPAFHIVRLLLLACAAHMFVAVAPLFTGDTMNGFWQYNKTLFLRILVSALFAHVVFAGLAFALAALDNLFGMEIPGERYGQLWAGVCGLFTTAFFLAGIPRNITGLATVTDFPKGLKVFAQNILLPIVIVYLVILYAYIAKILVSWDWPQGWVSKLILGFSGTGIFALLLLHPLSRQLTSVWVRTLTRWFYVILIPIVVMLFFAVWRRVSEYGLTEGRYIALAFGGWLLVIIAYFLLSGKKNIMFIPATLCAGALLVSYGPWNVFAMSERSQVTRLETLLRQNGMLLDGKVTKARAGTPVADAREISAVLVYLQELHGYEAIQPWFDAPLREDMNRPGVGYRSAPAVVEILGLQYVRPRRDLGTMVILTTDRQRTWDITGYDRLLRSQFFSEDRAGNETRIGEIAYRSSNSFDSLTVIVSRDPARRDSVIFPVRQLVDALMKERDSRQTDDMPPEAMCLTAASGGLRAKLSIIEIRIERSEQQATLRGYTADILYALGEHPN